MTGRNQLIHIGKLKRVMAHLVAVVAIALRWWRRMTTRPTASPAIVVLEPFGLGDVVALEPLVRVLKQHEVQVTLCAAPAWRPVLQGVRWVNSRIAWGGHTRGEKYSKNAYFSPEFRDFFEALRQVCRGAIGIDPRGDVRSVLLLYAAGCREVITLENYQASDLRMAGAVGRIVEYLPHLRRWELNLKFLEPLGIKPGDVQRPQCPHLKIAEKPPARRIAVMPVAPWPGKWWPAENWRTLEAALRRRGFDVSTLCGPGQSALASEQTGAESPVECGSVEQWAERLQDFACVVTLDSGPMHLADALDVPVVALFGQGTLPLWAPSHPQSAVVTHQTDPDFRVCAAVEANTPAGQEFMRRISVDEVLAAVDRMMSSQPR